MSRTTAQTTALPFVGERGKQQQQQPWRPRSEVAGGHKWQGSVSPVSSRPLVPAKRKAPKRTNHTSKEKQAARQELASDDRDDSHAHSLLGALRHSSASEDPNSRSTVPLRIPLDDLVPEDTAAEPQREQEPDQGDAKVYGDFTPWDGHQPEDQLTEHTIREGYSAKPKVQNEMGSARASLWPHMKSGASSASLSSAFVYALRQRQERDLFTSTATFKPPPRVTLTDSRKNTWLSELASDSVPLRRLSRTIPHGVRGKVLLGQCLQNRIPIARAMWLVKCVGANELRAFRRKGVSDSTVTENEVKWICEWTDLVERFISDPIRGSDPTYDDYEYALQITYHIFSEGLLDQDRFLSRLHASLQSASTDVLPLELLKLQCWLSRVKQSLTHSYWTANTCLTRIFELSNNALFRSLVDGLQKMATSFANDCPLSLLSFHLDDDERPTMPCHEFPQFKVTTLTNINDLMISSLQHRSHRLQTASALMQRLKAHPAKLEQSFEAYAGRPNIDVHNLLYTLLEWATSAFIYGESRVYAALRVMQSLQNSSRENSPALVLAIDHACRQSGVAAMKLCHLVAEAVRAKTLDAGVYIRWLVSTGASEGEGPSAETHAHVLCNIPTEALSSGLCHVLQQLIRRTSLPAQAREKALAEDPHWPQRFQISSDILRKATSVPKSKLLEDKKQVEQMAAFFESIGDQSALSSYLRLVVPIAGNCLLPVLAEITSEHRKCLAAMDELEGLRTLLLQQYQNLKMSGGLERSTLTAYLDLFSAFPANKAMVRHITEEIAHYDSRPGIAANTPASDFDVHTEVEQGDAVVPEAIVAISRKHASLGELLKAVVGALNLIDTVKMGTEYAVSAFRTALDRMFDWSIEAYTAALSTELTFTHAAGESFAARRLLKFVLVSKILPVLPLCARLAESCQAGTPGANSLSLDALDLLVDCYRPESLIHREGLTVSTRRSFELQISLADSESRRSILKLFASLIKTCGEAMRPCEVDRLHRLCGTDMIVFEALEIIDEGTFDICTLFDGVILEPSQACLNLFATRLIDPLDSHKIRARPFPEQVTFMLRNASACSVPVFRASLQLLKLSRQASLENTSLETLQQIIFNSVTNGQLFWASIIDLVPHSDALIEQIRSEAESALLARHEPSSSSPMQDVSSPLSGCSSSTLLEVIRALARALPENGTPRIATGVIDTLTGLVRTAQSEGPPGKRPQTQTQTDTPSDAQPQRDIDAAIHDLLHLALIHKPTFRPLSSSSHARTSSSAPPPSAPTPTPTPSSQPTPAAPAPDKSATVPEPTSSLIRLLCRLVPDSPSPSSSGNTSTTGIKLKNETRLLARATLAFFVLAIPPSALEKTVAPLPAALLGDPTLRFILGGVHARHAPASGLVLRSVAPVLGTSSSSSSQGQGQAQSSAVAAAAAGVHTETDASAPPSQPPVPASTTTTTTTSTSTLTSATATTTTTTTPATVAAVAAMASATQSVGVPFVRSAWEMLPDAGGEDTAVGLRLFAARKVDS